MIYDPWKDRFEFPWLDERIAALTERIERRKRAADGMAELRAIPGFAEHATGKDVELEDALAAAGITKQGILAYLKLKRPIDDDTPEEWNKESRPVDWLTPRGDVLYADANGWYTCPDYCPCDPDMHIDLLHTVAPRKDCDRAKSFAWKTLSHIGSKWRPHKSD